MKVNQPPKFVLLAVLPMVMASCGKSSLKVEPGVSLQLARHRAAILSDIHYDLRFRLTNRADEAITGSARISFVLQENAVPLQLDFRGDADHLRQLTSNGQAADFQFQNEYIIIPPDELAVGNNVVEIDFIAGSTSLNRNPDYLYTLFVPDRARTAFPLFDQPDLKATYDLALDIPHGWTAMSNAPIASARDVEVIFERSDRISSYLFSFVAGKFETVSREIDGRRLTMLHRETDAGKVERNIDEIFNLHVAALDWLEEYTGIDYPFKKFAFVLIPAFQYGGMEHVGAIQYRASSLFLEEAPSDTQLLGRASLIAHETAHMWFGDLVTMQWFNDVWTKEVFANFMAAKIVNPSFPNIDHDVNFLIRHYPGAYSVDRSEGANPIRQYLPNLNQAGQLYGAIIYDKAPIMMRQLEQIIGEERFREGMQEYLQTFSFANATWPALIEILDRKSDQNLVAWSDTWVNTAGRPEANQQPDAMAYGLFPPDMAALDRWQTLDDVSKASTLINLYENLLAGRGPQAANYLARLRDIAESEQNQLVLNLALGQLRQVFWRLLDDDVRAANAPLLEQALWDAMLAQSAASRRKIYFQAFADIALTGQGVQKAYDAWSRTPGIENLPLSENDLIALAQVLAIKLPGAAEQIVAEQVRRTENPDNVRKLEFIAPSLSPDRAIRDRFFASLADEANREMESWVLDALANLHHPLRTSESERYILPSLELLHEIQVTGDVFFPKGWLDETLGNYRSTSAVNTVRTFLRERPDYNAQLRMKILQAADMLFRANKMTGAS